MIQAILVESIESFPLFLSFLLSLSVCRHWVAVIFLMSFLQTSLGKCLIIANGTFFSMNINTEMGNWLLGFLLQMISWDCLLFSVILYIYVYIHLGCVSHTMTKYTTQLQLYCALLEIIASNKICSLNHIGSKLKKIYYMYVQTYICKYIYIYIYIYIGGEREREREFYMHALHVILLKGMIY